MKKLLSLLISYFVYPAGNAMNFLLPEDGSVQPRMLLDLDVPDSDVEYLAEADVIAGYEEKYLVYGDTLVCRRVPGASSPRKYHS